MKISIGTALFVFMKVTLAEDSGRTGGGPDAAKPKAVGDPRLNYIEVQLNAPAAAATTDTDTSSAIPKKQHPKKAVMFLLQK